MEYLDIFDDQNRIIGRATKKEVYARKLAHRIVHVMIFNRRGDLALQLRTRDRSFAPHHWVTSAGGHVSSGETYEQAARREMMEETGVDIPLRLRYKDVFQDPLRGNIKKFLTTFEVVFDGPFHINPKEGVEQMTFFSLDTIQDMVNRNEKIHPELLFLLKKHYGIK
ncbi:MAG: NUDIX domain-containing protein [Parcubacteria group bacterium]